MKKRLALILGGWAVWVFLMTIPVLADAGPHRKYTGTGTPSTSCASCHRAHTAQAPMLLTEAQPALCYSCHGETGQGGELNVEGGVEFPSNTAYTPGSLTATGFAALRGGGFKWAAIDAAGGVSGLPVPPAGSTSNPKDIANISKGKIGILHDASNNVIRAAATSAHNTDPSLTIQMWGNGPVDRDGWAGPWVTQVTCGSCHDPHGSGSYRLLRGIPNGSGATVSVNIADPTTKTYTTTNYWDVSYPEAPDVVSKISSWCTTCHTRYLADNFADTPTANGGPPNGDGVFSFRHQTDTTAAFSPNCLQCHVSHGSNAAMTRSAGTVPLPGSTIVPSETSRLLRAQNRMVCQFCHLR